MVQATVAALLNEANRLKQLGQLTEAISAYRRAGQLNPNLPWCHHNLGEVLAIKGQWQEAVESYRRAIQVNPNSAWSHYKLAEALIHLNNLTQAETAFRRAIEINYNFFEFHNSLGEILFRLKRIDEAIVCYRKAIEIDPEAASPYRNLAEVFVQQDKLDEAITYAKKALDIDPGDWKSYQVSGKILEKQGLLNEAKERYEEALKLQPNSAEIFQSLGDIFLNLNQLEKAIALYEKAIELNPNLLEAQDHLGFALAKFQRGEEALVHYRKALQLSPDSDVVHYHLGEALTLLRRWTEAITAYSKVTELNPNWVEAYKNLAEVLQKRGEDSDLEKAYHCYLKVIELNPNDLESYQNLLNIKPDQLDLYLPYGNLLLSQNKVEDAISFYQKLLEKQPDNIECYLKLGEAWVRTNAFEQAIALYSKVIELNPGCSEAYHRIGEPLQRQGKLDEAISAYRKAIEVDPDYFGSYHALGDLLQQQGEFEEATVAYRRAIEVNPTFCWSYNNLGDALRKQRLLQESIAAYRGGIKANPEFAWCYYNLGTALAQESQFEEALTYLQKANQLDPMFRFDKEGLKNVLLQTSGGSDQMYDIWRTQNAPRKADFRKMAETLHLFQYKPLISIIVPVFNTPEEFLREAIESVINQIYPHWELCIADDTSTDPSIRQVLGEYTALDSRIKVVYRTENGHISKASNSALELATGEFITLLDHDDTLTPDALYEVALLLNRYPDADMIYSDEDKISPDGQLINPFFKPQWSPESFLSRMYTCHLGTYRKSIIEEIGGWRVGYEGAQDYDLVLRFTEKTEKIYHIPKILYHWRMHAGSAAGGTAAKPYAYEASKKALQDAIERRGEPGEVQGVQGYLGHHLVRFKIREYKRVSIIIPTRDLAGMVDQCLTSIFAKSVYHNYEVILIDNGSVEDSTFQMIEKWKTQEPERFKCYRLDIPFNFSKINNYGVSQASGDYLLFLNNDTEVVTPDWIDAMVEQAQRPGIGAVGVKLLFDDQTVQHAGVVLGLGGVAGHSYYRMPDAMPGYFGNFIGFNNVSAVTAACLMCRREVFEQVGGLDEDLIVAYNDVDLCLKMIDQGYRNLYLPHVTLYHHESKSRGYEDTPEKKARLARESKILESRWQAYIENDPCYSPHLSRTSASYDIRIND